MLDAQLLAFAGEIVVYLIASLSSSIPILLVICVWNIPMIFLSYSHEIAIVWK